MKYFRAIPLHCKNTNRCMNCRENFQLRGTPCYKYPQNGGVMNYFAKLTGGGAGVHINRKYSNCVGRTVIDERILCCATSTTIQAHQIPREGLPHFSRFWLILIILYSVTEQQLLQGSKNFHLHITHRKGLTSARV